MGYKAIKPIVFDSRTVSVGSEIPTDIIDLLKKSIDEEKKENGLDRLIRIGAVEAPKIEKQIDLIEEPVLQAETKKAGRPKKEVE